MSATFIKVKTVPKAAQKEIIVPVSAIMYISEFGDGGSKISFPNGATMTVSNTLLDIEKQLNS